MLVHDSPPVLYRFFISLLGFVSVVPYKKDTSVSFISIRMPLYLRNAEKPSLLKKEKAISVTLLIALVWISLRSDFGYFLSS